MDILKMRVRNFSNVQNKKNPFSVKILHRIKKGKKTDPPKTNQKTNLMERATSFRSFLEGVMAI